jgi:hypothetical protein
LLKNRLILLTLALTAATYGADGKLSALIIDGANNHDWAAGTRAIRSILEGSGRFTVDVASYPAWPGLSHYDVVINNFNGGHLADGKRWNRAQEMELEKFVSGGGGLVVFHAANNAFLNWPAY